MFGNPKRYTVGRYDNENLQAGVISDYKGRLRLERDYRDLDMNERAVGEIEAAITHIKKRITAKDRRYLEKKGIRIT